MTSLDAGQHPSVGFVPYDHVISSRFNAKTQRLFDQLKAKFNTVEVSELEEQGGAWCIRVVSEDGATPLPLAAIGNSPELAAERLWRIAAFF